MYIVLDAKSSFAKNCRTLNIEIHIFPSLNENRIKWRSVFLKFLKATPVTTAAVIDSCSCCVFHSTRSTLLRWTINYTTYRRLKEICIFQLTFLQQITANQLLPVFEPSSLQSFLPSPDPYGASDPPMRVALASFFWSLSFSLNMYNKFCLFISKQAVTNWKQMWRLWQQESKISVLLNLMDTVSCYAIRFLVFWLDRKYPWTLLWATRNIPKPERSDTGEK